MIRNVEPIKARSYTYSRSPIVDFVENDMSKKPKYVAKGKLPSNNGKNYYHIFLWGTQDDYERAAQVEKQRTLALTITNTYESEDGTLSVAPKLGELHFVSGTWDVNTAAHEVQHALIHRMRYLHPTPAMVLNERDPEHDSEDEEVLAYEAGAWVEAVLCWLTRVDDASPYPKDVFER